MSERYSHAYDPEFDRTYDAYPRHTAKPSAYNAWKRAVRKPPKCRLPKQSTSRRWSRQ